MKISANEAGQKIDALALIPMWALKQSTRIKVIRTQIAYEKVITDYRNDVNEGLKKLKPEGFDEKLQKYGNPTEYKGDFDADFIAFKAEYESVEAALQELQQSAAKEVKYEVSVPAFSDADWEDIAAARPSDRKTEINGAEVENDALLHHLMCVLP